MTDNGGSPYPDAVQLGPFQRAALQTHAAHRTVTVGIPDVSGTAVYEAALTVLRVHPALSAELVEVASLRVPWQRRAEVHGQSFPEEGRWEITSGATTVRIAQRAGGARLTVSTPPVFVDLPSLAGFFHLVGQALNGARITAAMDDFAVEVGHLEMMRAGELREEERYWRARGEEAIARTGDRLAEVAVVPARDSVNQASIPLDGPLLEAVSALATAVGADLCDVAHYALAVLLDRLGVDADRIARTVDARPLMGLTGAIGVFSHTVPGHPSVDPTDTVAMGLRAVVKQRCEEDDLIGCPSPRPEGELPEIVFSANGLRVDLPSAWRLEECTSAPDGHLVFACVDSGAAPELLVRIADDRDIDPRLLVRLWHTVLRGLADSPDSIVGEVTPADAALTAQLSTELRQAAGRPAAEDICRVLARRAAQDPDGTAVRWPGGRWSYAELLGYVQATAGRLPEVSDGDVVAVAGKSNQPQTILGVLSVLWRGAAFLPVDPDEPAARVADALARSKAVAILSEAPGLTVPAGVPTLPIDPTGVAGTAAPLTSPADVAATSAAYVLRTSGSTGRPKLVGVSRASLANYLRWVAETLVPSTLTTHALPALSPSVFDAGFKQTLGMLYSGRTVWLPGSDPRDPVALLAELSASDEAVAVNCVPSYWSVLMEAIADGPVPRIERVLLGGEPVTRALLRRTREALPAAQVWNLYGPTEATATATMGLLEDGETIHAGRPIAGAVVAVLDRYGAPLPEGIVGEIAVAGPGVALGYLDGQEGESPFITLPAPETHNRAYRTGDYGWIAGDGALRLVGRRDAQVKVNGWRIELGEIESVAEQLEGVSRGLAVVDDAAVLRLFVVGAADPEQVRSRLAALLPAAMLPSSIHVVREIPVLSSGKADRAALLAGLNRSTQEDPRVYDVEQRVVATVWRDLLGGGWPRVTDEFFDAGGHSLLLAQLVNRLRSQGYTQLSVRHVIRRPTVESIADLIRAKDTEDR
ncbi:hypothetical protein GCM10023322_71450 [Rugosimonospora acidiphila]|uniref:Carrier domain-containing protein n=1 Tax=Rugosimonospora acidiphila TaxID=556531 RepID=A0ABP9SMV7_9ACTN